MLAKPIGAIIFGKIGDLKGRSNSFKISLIGTAIASIIIYLTPSYEKIGLLSCFMLLLYRMVICALVSSGSDGVRIYVYEHISKSKQCLGVGIITLFTQAGSLTASISAWFFTLDIMPAHYWKISFLIGGILGLLVIIAMKISGFGDIEDVKQDEKFTSFEKLSIKDIISKNMALFFVCVLIAGGIGSTNQFIIIFFGTYSFKILQIIDRSLMQSYISAAIIAYMVFSLIAGYLADKYSRYYTVLGGLCSTIIFSLLLIYGFSKKELFSMAYIGVSSSLPFITMPAAAILKQSIPKSIRYRIFSLSHALGSVFISAPTALFATLLYNHTGLIWLPILYFILIVLIISLALHYLARSVFKKG